jgi:hypothetical protein
MMADGISSAGISSARTSTFQVIWSLRDRRSGDSPVAHLTTASGIRPETGDTVTLPKKEGAADSSAARRGADTNGTRRMEAPRNVDGVVFVYNFKGDLRVKFMDSFNNLVYQTPPEFLTRISDIMDGSSGALDMTV